MSAVRKLLVGVMLTCAVMTPTVSRAQVEGVHVSLFPWYGYADFSNDTNFEDEPIWGGTAGLGLGRYFAIEGHVGRSTTETHAGFTHYPISFPSAPREVTALHYGANVTVNLLPEVRLVPYLMAGWAEAKFDFADEDSVPEPEYQNGWEFGAGLKYRINPRLAIRAEVRDNIWHFPEGTPAAVGTDPINNWFYAAGVEFLIGGIGGGDDDQDKVSNAKDKCPNTPIGARVDANGCPIDSDSDGVPDGIDQCPNTVAGATVDSRGCPRDSDSDGVPDGVDQCPDTPSGSPVDARGCPRDSDGDGIPDGQDQCADTPAGIRVDPRGCPLDADNDGVTDDKDQCPFTSPNVKVDAVGCPIELTTREIELLDKGRITERNIHFVTAKWDILPESRPVLDEIGQILIQWPRLRIEVGGHADARGSDAYNLDLSDKRANAVLNYLVSKFPQITREQYSARGYGEREPVATNKTVEGMAQNRRVEFKVLNTEELTKERERRQLQQK
ncbi:MAG TPA: OmpA family protein [Candidatus Eisenbacteria bacterium]|nr:OmpA family protein [Candidatus Eisenbacteria bacterium]